MKHFTVVLAVVALVGAGCDDRSGEQRRAGATDASVVAGTEPGEGRTATSLAPVSSGSSVPAGSGDDVPKPSDAVIDVPGVAAMELASPVRLYSGDPADPGFGLSVDVADGVVDGPAGFGVDESGTAYLVDGNRHRVVVAGPGGSMSVEQLPGDLAGEWIAGFAVSADGSQYMTLADGLASVRDGTTVGRWTREELGWNGVYLGPKATTDGLWVGDPDDSWTLVAKGSELATPRTSGPDSRPGVPDDSVVSLGSVDGGTISLTVGKPPVAEASRITLNTGAENVSVVVHTEVDGAVVIAYVDTTVPDRLAVVVVPPRGAAHAVAVPIQPGNMVQNGIYADVIGRQLLVESGSKQLITLDSLTLEGLE